MFGWPQDIMGALTVDGPSPQFDTWSWTLKLGDTWSPFYRESGLHNTQYGRLEQQARVYLFVMDRRALLHPPRSTIARRSVRKPRSTGASNATKRWCRSHFRLAQTTSGTFPMSADIDFYHYHYHKYFYWLQCIASLLNVLSRSPISLCQIIEELSSSRYHDRPYAQSSFLGHELILLKDIAPALAVPSGSGPCRSRCNGGRIIMTVHSGQK